MRPFLRSNGAALLALSLKMEIACTRYLVAALGEWTGMLFIDCLNFWREDSNHANDGATPVLPSRYVQGHTRILDELFKCFVFSYACLFRWKKHSVLFSIYTYSNFPLYRSVLWVARTWISGKRCYRKLNVVTGNYLLDTGQDSQKQIESMKKIQNIFCRNQNSQQRRS
jgi:hypothetical protein